MNCIHDLTLIILLAFKTNFKHYNTYKYILDNNAWLILQIFYISVSVSITIDYWLILIILCFLQLFIIILFFIFTLFYCLTVTWRWLCSKQIVTCNKFCLFMILDIVGKKVLLIANNQGARRGRPKKIYALTSRSQCLHRA